MVRNQNHRESFSKDNQLPQLFIDLVMKGM
jgi:hypothetical protein